MLDGPSQAKGSAVLREVQAWDDLEPDTDVDDRFVRRAQSSSTAADGAAGGAKASALDSAGDELPRLPNALPHPRRSAASTLARVDVPWEEGVDEVVLPGRVPPKRQGKPAHDQGRLGLTGLGELELELQRPPKAQPQPPSPQPHC